MDPFNPKPSSQWLPLPYSFFDVPNHELESHLNASKDLTFSMQEEGDNFVVDFIESSLNDGQTEEDLFATYIDMEKIESEEANVGRVDGGGGGRGGGRRGKGRGKRKEKGENVKQTQPKKRGRQCRQNSRPVNDAGGVVEPRKAMVAEELAQLWTVDPKRAKRIMANRQSAARSKERKAQHILHLEEKVKTYNSEVTTLTTHIEILQRETAHLAAERSELEIRLNTMQHEIEIHDGETQELQMELIRLKNSIAETDTSKSSRLNVENNHTSQGQSNLLSKPLDDTKPLELSQHMSMLHNTYYTSQPYASPHQIQQVDSTHISELLQFFEIGISPEHKTNSGQFFAIRDSISTSLITGESSTISY